MRGAHARVNPEPLRLHEVPREPTWKHSLRKIRLFVRHTWCRIVNGGHELYRARTDDRLFQECLMCGYKTVGWTIDRRDRRLSPFGKK